MSKEVKIRSGGRKARVKRAAPSFTPSRMGTAGGSYSPLSDAEVNRIHSAAMDVLETTGIKGATDTVREVALEAGCRLDESGRLLFPRALVEDAIAGAARDFVLHGQSPEHDIEVRDGHVHFGTGGAAVTMLDSRTGDYRPSTLEDLFDIARLMDTLTNLTCFSRPIVATDLVDWRELDLNTVYACARGSQKHLGTSITLAKHVPEIIEMLDIMTGRAGGFAERPFLSVHATTIVSPLTFAEDSSDVATAAALNGMPIMSQTGPLAGATAPTALAGTLVQTAAENLGALVAINLIKRGHPVICAGWPMVADLRTGAFSGGGGEQALLSAGQTQMMRFYKLPNGAPAGMSDSKLPDNQAGYEKAITVALSAMSGPNFIYESAGMMASLMGCSLEALAIDDEMIALIRRTMRGIEVTDDTLSVNMINDTARNVGHYLGNTQTLALMETEYVYPSLADRESTTIWTEQGSTDMYERAKVHVSNVMENNYPAHISDEADARVRELFPIRLPLDVIKGNRRQGTV